MKYKNADFIKKVKELIEMSKECEDLFFFVTYSDDSEGMVMGGYVLNCSTNIGISGYMTTEESVTGLRNDLKKEVISFFLSSKKVMNRWIEKALKSV